MSSENKDEAVSVKLIRQDGMLTATCPKCQAVYAGNALDGIARSEKPTFCQGVGIGCGALLWLLL